MADSKKCASSSVVLDEEYQSLYRKYIQPVFDGVSTASTDFSTIKNGLNLGPEICQGGCGHHKGDGITQLTPEQTNNLRDATPLAKEVVEHCLREIVEYFFAFDSLLTWENSLSKGTSKSSASTFGKYWGILLFISFIMVLCRETEKDALTIPIRDQYLALFPSIPCFMFHWWLAKLFQTSFVSDFPSLLFSEFITTGDMSWKSYISKKNTIENKSDIQAKIGVSLQKDAKLIKVLPYPDLLVKLRKQCCLNILMNQADKKSGKSQKIQDFIKKQFDTKLPIPESSTGRYYDYQYYSLCLSRLCALRDSPVEDISNAVLDIPDFNYPHYPSLESLYSRDTELEITPYLFGHIGIKNLTVFRQLLRKSEQAIFPVRCRISASTEEKLPLSRLNQLLQDTLMFRTSKEEEERSSQKPLPLPDATLETVESVIKSYQNSSNSELSYLLIVQDVEDENQSEFRFLPSQTPEDSEEVLPTESQLAICFVRAESTGDSTTNKTCLTIEPVILLYGNPFSKGGDHDENVGVCYNSAIKRFFKKLSDSTDITVSKASPISTDKQTEPIQEVVEPVQQKTYILPSDQDKFAHDKGLSTIVIKETTYLMGDAYLYQIMGKKKLVHNVYDAESQDLSLKGIVYLKPSTKSPSKPPSKKCGIDSLKVYDLTELDTKKSCQVIFIPVSESLE